MDEDFDKWSSLILGQLVQLSNKVDHLTEKVNGNKSDTQERIAKLEGGFAVAEKRIEATENSLRGLFDNISKVVVAVVIFLVLGVIGLVATLRGGGP